MENAVLQLFNTSDPLLCEARDRLLEDFSGLPAWEFDQLWHARNFCRQLLSVNPLRLKTSQNAAFWAVFETEYNSVVSDICDERYDFIVDINAGECIHRMSYTGALAAMLRTLQRPALVRKMSSVYNLPEHIILAYIKSPVLRKKFFNNYVYVCEDRIDIYSYYNRGLLDNGTLSEVLEVLEEEQDYFVTPRPELAEEERPDNRKFKLSERALRRDFVPETVVNISDMLGFYTYLWTEVGKTVDSVTKSFSTKHSQNCRCIGQVLDMRTLFPLLRAMVEQSIDLRTLARPAFRQLCINAEPLLRCMGNVASNITAYLRGEPAHYELEPYLSCNQLRPERLVERIESSYTDCNHWLLVETFACPIEYLLAELDQHYLLVTGAWLRQFLATRERYRYLAYRLPRETTLFYLQTTIARLRKAYANEFPELEELYPLRTATDIYLVAQPAALHIMRCLMLGYLSTLQSSPQVAVVDLPQSYIALRNYFVQTSLGEHGSRNAATCCLVQMLVIFLGVNRAGTNTFRVDGIAMPSDGHLFAIYTRLPQLVAFLSQSSFSDHARKVVLSNFLMQKRRRVCNAGSIKVLLHSLSNQMDPLHPHYSTVESMYARHRKSKKIQETIVIKPLLKSGECIVAILTELILDSTLFSQREIQQHLLALYGDERILKKNSKNKYSMHTPQNMPARLNRCAELFLSSEQYFQRLNRLSEKQLQTCVEQRKVDCPLASVDATYVQLRASSTYRIPSKEFAVPQCYVAEFCSFVLELECEWRNLAQPENLQQIIMQSIYTDEAVVLPYTRDCKFFFELSLPICLDSSNPPLLEDTMERIRGGKEPACNSLRNMLEHLADAPGRWVVPDSAMQGNAYVEGVLETEKRIVC
jgi:hypothetical protein